MYISFVVYILCHGSWLTNDKFVYSFVYACNVLSSNVFRSFLSMELVGNFGMNVVY